MQTPNFLDKANVLAIHEDQIASFGGTVGIRDEGLLESALAQPQATFGGQFLHATIHEQASAYLYHLAMNHPFIDGNKRTAYAVMDTFLRVNGYALALTDEQSYGLVLDVANGRATKEDVVNLLQEYATPDIDKIERS